MKVGTLSQTHPDHNSEHLGDLRTLYVGGQRFREQAGRFICKNAQEPQDVYQDRLRRAVYINHAGPITNVLAAYLFSEAPTLDGMSDDYFESWVAGVDGRGTPLRRWFRTLFEDALVGKRSYVWVNLPQAPMEVEPENYQAQERAGLLDAYLVRLTAEQVIDWGADDRGELAWVMVHDIVDERAGVEAERTKVWRWTAIDATQVRRWEWRPTKGKTQPSDEDIATELEPITHGMGRLPVLRLELPDGLWVMSKLHDPAVGHLRQRNDLSWALHRAAHALLVLKRKLDGESPTLGAGYYLQIGPDDDAFYAEPNGANFNALAEDVKALREEMYRVVQQMALAVDSNSPRSRMSAASKERDWDATEIVLSAYADLVRGVVHQTAALVAQVRSPRSEAPEFSVGGLAGWQQEDLSTFLEQAAMATDAHAMSPTFRKTVAKREASRLLQDETDAGTLDAIHAEIDAADADPAPYRPPPRPEPGHEGGDASP